MLPTLIGITLMVFSIMALAPGGVGASLLTRGGDLRPEERAAMEAYINQRYGLDKPLPHQYLRWLNNVSPLGFEEVDEGEDRFGFKVPDLGMSVAGDRVDIRSITHNVIIEFAECAVHLYLFNYHGCL